MAYKDPAKKRENARRWRLRNADKVRASQKKYRASEKGRQRSSENFRQWQLPRTYGITVADYERMLAEQNGVCAICGLPPEGTHLNNRRLQVDHNHETGEVRGLLCRSCNYGLGCFQDQPLLLRAASLYLTKNPSSEAGPDLVSDHG